MSNYKNSISFQRDELEAMILRNPQALYFFRYYNPPEPRRKKPKRKQKRKAISVGDFVESENDGMQGTVLEVGTANVPSLFQNILTLFLIYFEITILSTASVVHEIPKGKIKVLRSADKLLLVELNNVNKTIRGTAAPKLWNSLPFPVRFAQSINVSKSLLKTYLFPFCVHV